MNSDIFVVILTWNNYDDTWRSVTSVLSSSVDVSVVVVDNGSSDGSIERLKAEFLGEARVRFIRTGRNLGFAGGVNVGIRFALANGARAVFLLNNDAIVDKECLKQLVDAAFSDPSIGIAGPRIFYWESSERIWQGGGHFCKAKTGVVVPEKNKRASECQAQTRYVTFLTGCAVLIKREVFEKIGLFDEAYFLYEEDVDFCLRASRSGFKLLYVPSASAWHKIGSVARERTSPSALYHMARSRILLLRKHFRGPYLWYGLLVHLLGYTPFRLFQALSGSRRPESAAAWVRGTFAGLLIARSKLCWSERTSA